MRVKVCCLAVVALLCGCAAQTEKDVEPDAAEVTVILSSKRSRYSRGDEMLLSATVSNRSDRTLTVPAGTPWVNNQFLFGIEVLVLQGDKNRYYPILPPMAGIIPGETNFVSLPPGGAVTSTFYIDDFVPRAWGGEPHMKICNKRGRYNVRARVSNSRRGYDVKGEDGKPVFKEVQDMWLGMSKWAELSVEVTGHGRRPKARGR